MHEWHAVEGGYNHQQSTRPNTLAIGLGDSPAGLAGDIVSAPRQFAARFFDIQSWAQPSGGGHFDAWERPADYAAGIRAAVAHRRPEG